MTDRHFSDTNEKFLKVNLYPIFFNMMAGMLIASLWVATIMVFKSIKGFLNILNIKGTFNLKQTRGVIWPYWGQITPLIAISIFLGLKGISMELFITKCVCLFPFSINYAPVATWRHINRHRVQECSRMAPELSAAAPSTSVTRSI